MFMNGVLKKDLIRQIAIEDLREFGIKCRPKKIKVQNEAIKRNRRLFKVDLQLLPKQTVTLSTGQQLEVPKLVHELCSFILTRVETEGLFRKAGSKARQNQLRILLDAGCLLEDSQHVIDVANLLKTFLRELPEPLFPYAFHDYFLRCMLLSGDNNLKALLLTCLLLPSEHLNVLTYFLQFLNEVTKYSTINKMDSYNLSVVIGPTVFPFQDKLPNTTHRLTKICELVKLLIENACSIGLISEKTIHFDRMVQPSTSTTSLPDVDIKNKRRKKRRSGSLTRMFNGLRKIVGSKQCENSSPVSITPDLLKTPNLSKSSRKRKLEVSGLSHKKRLEVIQSLPQATTLSTPISINSNPKRISPYKSTLKNKSDSNCDIAVKAKSTLERRWSAVSESNMFKRTRNRNSCGVLPTVIEIKPSPTSLEEKTSSNLVVDTESNYIKIPVREYEEIKNRVTALERQISLELTQLDNRSIKTDNYFDIQNVENLAQIQTAYEKTLSEAEYLSPTTDLLAQRLGKELKIRRSAEQKIVRSPSARKIGSLRRRSKELEKQNVKVQRNQSWHVQGNGSVQRIYLKRGKPNSISAGLRSRTPLEVNQTDEDMDCSSESLPVNISRSNSLIATATPEQNSSNIPALVKWTSAERFFCKLKTPDSHNAVRSSIARLRNQNAGMVLAKAKLFDGLTDSDTSGNLSSSTQQIKLGNKIGAVRSSNRLRSFKCDEKYSTRQSVSPKKKYVKSPDILPSLQLCLADKENQLEYESIYKDFSDCSIEKIAFKEYNPNCVGDHIMPSGMPYIKRSLGLKSPKRISAVYVGQDNKHTPFKVLPNKRVY